MRLLLTLRLIGKIVVVVLPGRDACCHNALLLSGFDQAYIGKISNLQYVMDYNSIACDTDRCAKCEAPCNCP